MPNEPNEQVSGLGAGWTGFQSPLPQAALPDTRPMPPPPPQLVDDLAALIERRTMMLFGTDRRAYLIATATTRAKAGGFPDAATYVRRLLTNPTDPELMSLVDALTINETTFYRNVPQLDLFARVALRETIARRRAGNEQKRIEVWSAGCSTGQEVYTLAALASDALLTAPDFDFGVFGTDLAQSCVDTARRAVYPKARLDATPEESLRRHFEDLGDSIRPNAALRSKVRFQQHNLRDPFPPGRYDVIFCRNVMIYFTREEQTRLAREFFDRLAPGGFLFIGHSESLQGTGVNFRLRIEARGVAYQKVG